MSAETFSSLPTVLSTAFHVPLRWSTLSPAAQPAISAAVRAACLACPVIHQTSADACHVKLFIGILSVTTAHTMPYSSHLRWQDMHCTCHTKTVTCNSTDVRSADAHPKRSCLQLMLMRCKIVTHGLTLDPSAERYAH
jgi:hypothetical protein